MAAHGEPSGARYKQSARALEPVKNGSRTGLDLGQTDAADLNGRRNRPSGISGRASVTLDVVPCPDVCQDIWYFWARVLATQSVRQHQSV
jgi:hypothetical protein